MTPKPPSDGLVTPAMAAEVRVSPNRCPECGGPFIWDARWQGWDCHFCNKNELHRLEDSVSAAATASIDSPGKAEKSGESPYPPPSDAQHAQARDLTAHVGCGSLDDYGKCETCTAIRSALASTAALHEENARLLKQLATAKADAADEIQQDQATQSFRAMDRAIVRYPELSIATAGAGPFIDMLVERLDAEAARAKKAEAERDTLREALDTIESCEGNSFCQRCGDLARAAIKETR